MAAQVESPQATEPVVAEPVAAAFEGQLEYCGSDEIRGWAWDRRNTQAVFVSIAIDGDPVCTVIADQHRADLEESGKRDGRCGFSIVPPSWCQDGRIHQVRVYVLNARPEFLISETSVRFAKQAVAPLPWPSRAFFHLPQEPGSQTQSARALLGRNRWLFLADDSNRCLMQITGRFPVSDKALADYRASFVRRRAILNDLGIPYLFFIAPTKEVVCSDRLPRGIEVDLDRMPASRISRAVAEDGFDIQLLAHALRAGEAERSTYFRTDTHWNAYGAHVAYRHVINEVGKIVACGAPHPYANFALKPYAGWRGDLAHKEKVCLGDGIDDLVPVSPSAFPRSVFAEDIEQLFDESGMVKDVKPDDHLRISRTRDTVVREHVDKSLPRAVFLRDSFTLPMIPMLQRHFSRSVFLWTPDLYVDVIKREKPDVIVQIMVDRFFVRVPDNI
ncbi:MAG: hypothetical protein CTY25_03605 [Methylobacterium sp.]|nr:MAG: hypothetical protein CTY25_03605 [Methylobacterium sp.]